MSVVSRALKFRSLQQDDVAWHLLHAQNAPYIMAILEEHLGRASSTRPVAEMIALTDASLEELRERLFDGNFPKSGKEYLEDWRREGYLIRKVDEREKVETYQLSGGALAAIGFAKNLADPHRTATKSRLGIIFDQITKLALNLSVDEERRRRALLAEQQAITDKLRALDLGQIDTIDQAQAMESAQEIIGLAREIPQDFALVSGEFEAISRNLYSALMTGDEESQNLLEDVFAGVDHISASPAGRSFGGFYELLRDTEEYERLCDDIDSILESPLADGMPQEERSFLRHLMRTLFNQGRTVNDTKTLLAHSLRRYVQSQSFQEDRLLKRMIDKALSDATELTETVSLGHEMCTSLVLTATPISPISRLRLYAPADAVAEAQSIECQTAPPALSIEELRERVRLVEIDFNELATSVNEVLKGCSSDEPVSVGTVLSRFPATQGVASIMGLLLLGLDQGIPGEGQETATWTTEGGRTRTAHIPLLFFNKEVS